jgi:hypothetical protein
MWGFGYAQKPTLRLAVTGCEGERRNDLNRTQNLIQTPHIDQNSQFRIANNDLTIAPVFA